MRYYHGTRAHDLPDESVWMAYEVAEEKDATRIVEHFAIGRTDHGEASREDCVSLVDQAFEVSESDLDEATTPREITADEFESLRNRQNDTQAEP